MGGWIGVLTCQTLYGWVVGWCGCTNLMEPLWVGGLGRCTNLMEPLCVVGWCGCTALMEPLWVVGCCGCTNLMEPLWVVGWCGCTALMDPLWVVGYGGCTNLLDPLWMGVLTWWSLCGWLGGVGVLTWWTLRWRLWGWCRWSLCGWCLWWLVYNRKKNESCSNGCYVRVAKSLFTQSANENFLCSLPLLDVNSQLDFMRTYLEVRPGLYVTFFAPFFWNI